jgi:hypothetical protein
VYAPTHVLRHCCQYGQCSLQWVNCRASRKTCATATACQRELTSLRCMGHQMPLSVILGGGGTTSHFENVQQLPRSALGGVTLPCRQSTVTLSTMQAGEGQGVAPYNHHVNLTSSYFLLKCVPSRDGGATQGFEANDPFPTVCFGAAAGEVQ